MPCPPDPPADRGPAGPGPREGGPGPLAPPGRGRGRGGRRPVAPGRPAGQGRGRIRPPRRRARLPSGPRPPWTCPRGDQGRAGPLAGRRRRAEPAPPDRPSAPGRRHPGGEGPGRGIPQGREPYRPSYLAPIAEAEAEAGDVDGALANAATLEGSAKAQVVARVAAALVRKGDDARARQVADSIRGSTTATRAWRPWQCLRSTSAGTPRPSRRPMRRP